MIEWNTKETEIESGNSYMYKVVKETGKQNVECRMQLNVK